MSVGGLAIDASVCCCDERVTPSTVSGSADGIAKNA
jgi:hypothetical protein